MIFFIMYIIKLVIGALWKNNTIQRFIVIVPSIVGIIIFIIDTRSVSVQIVCNGILSGFISMAFYKFLKDILGKDFFDFIKDFFQKKVV